jgi:hypothetical protein
MLKPQFRFGKIQRQMLVFLERKNQWGGQRGDE